MGRPKKYYQRTPEQRNYCGHSENADVNAAKNIYSRGAAVVRQREALACA